jgi:hypothetical protein
MLAQELLPLLLHRNMSRKPTILWQLLPSWRHGRKTGIALVH